MGMMVSHYYCIRPTSLGFRVKDFFKGCRGFRISLNPKPKTQDPKP